MVIYQVNISIEDEIYHEYLEWLKPHLAQMLQFKGFKQVQLLQDEAQPTSPHSLVVIYCIDSRENLEDYFINHAPYMRAEAIEKFGSRFNITRSVFNIILELPILPQE